MRLRGFSGVVLARGSIESEIAFGCSGTMGKSMMEFAADPSWWMSMADVSFGAGWERSTVEEDEFSEFSDIRALISFSP
jgi:hypothetical protein